jgi:hypothetical protein
MICQLRGHLGKTPMRKQYTEHNYLFINDLTIFFILHVFRHVGGLGRGFDTKAEEKAKISISLEP